MTKVRKTKEFKLARNFLLSCAVFFISVLFILVPYKISLFAGRTLGFWFCFLFPRYRDIAGKNLKKAFPDKSPVEIKTVRDDVFRNMGMNLAELCMLNFRSRSFWFGRIEMKGKEHIDKALKEGKGIILLSAHIGNWELMGACLSMAGYPLDVAARVIKNVFLNNMLVFFRSLRGVNTVYRSGTENLRRMAESLKKGRVLGILIDQDTRKGGEFVDFFGMPCYTPLSVARFSELRNTVVLPGFIYRKKDLRHSIRIMPAITKISDRVAATAVHSRIIEDFLRKYPSQWIWFHRRWKRQPV